MKKTMILSLAILGMVLGSVVGVQPAMAGEDCEYFSDDYQCNYALCGWCLAYQCPGGPTIIDCPTED